MATLLSRRATCVSLGGTLLSLLARNGLHAAPAATALAPAATEPALWNRLRQGGYVLFIRHATAPGTFDPEGFKLEDCSTQRNLSEEGRAQAVRMGELFRSMKVPVDEVLSSQWCRCLDTATLAFGAAAVKPWPTLNSPVQLSPEQRQAQTTALRERTLQFRPTGKHARRNLVLVTHMFVIQDVLQQAVSQGDIVVVRGGDKSLRVVGRIAV
jgi:phosphohistidine phosphatase SixA